MKIIHCSDIHLDSRMERNFTPAQARERNAEICATFARMVSFAVRNGVRVVLIAGDLFDTERATAQTAGFVLDQIRGAKDVDFLYLRGNHDEGRNIFFGMQLPENLKTFENDWGYCRYDNVVIAGLEMDRENCFSMYDTLRLNPEDTNIVMLHGQEASQSGGELIALPRLKGKHIRYLALGHLHSYKKERLDLEGEYCYCGCLEGRGFDECGEKGFVLLDAREGRIAAEFVPFARRTLREVKADITGLESVSEILEAMKTAASDVSPESPVKVTLTGSYTPDTQKDLRFLQKMLQDRYYFVRIKDESVLTIDRESYEHDVSLKGEFIRMVLASDKPQAEKEKIILCGIRALSGEEVGL